MGEQIIGRLLPEWLNSNQHRTYPLDESTVGNGVPFGFLVDALFINSPTIDSERLYISSVSRSNTNILIRMGGYVERVKTDFGVVATIPFNTVSGAHIPISVVGGNFTLAGSLVVGDTKCMEYVPAVIELDEYKGLIFPGCVRTVSDTLLGIKVNDILYTGIVTLEAGEGIEITASAGDEEGETVITITSTAYTVPDENLKITSDSELLANAIEAYGKPVRTICNVSPDASGDIVFSTPDAGGESEQYVEASSTGIGTVCLTIANDKTDITCTDRSAQIEALTQALSNLNDRSVEVHEGVNALDDAVSNLALQVARS